MILEQHIADRLQWTLDRLAALRQDAAGGRADSAPYRSAGISHTGAPVHITSCGSISN
jgi:hypothetical protein